MVTFASQNFWRPSFWKKPRHWTVLDVHDSAKHTPRQFVHSILALWAPLNVRADVHETVFLGGCAMKCRESTARPLKSNLSLCFTSFFLMIFLEADIYAGGIIGKKINVRDWPLCLTHVRGRPEIVDFPGCCPTPERHLRSKRQRDQGERFARHYVNCDQPNKREVQLFFSWPPSKSNLTWQAIVAVRVVSLLRHCSFYLVRIYLQWSRHGQGCIK